jgi:hypothetical protein
LHKKTKAVKQRIYIDTSVVGGYFDKEFANATNMLFERFDCVQMKNDIQAKIYAEIKGMNTSELLSYFNTPFEKKRKQFANH